MELGKTVRPLYTGVIVTADVNEEDLKEGNIIVSWKGAYKEIQEVVAIGSSVRDLAVGDKVSVNLMRYAELKHNEGSLKNGVVCDNPVVRYHMKTFEMGGRKVMLIDCRDIELVL